MLHLPNKHDSSCLFHQRQYYEQCDSHDEGEATEPAHHHAYRITIVVVHVNSDIYRPSRRDARKQRS